MISTRSGQFSRKIANCPQGWRLERRDRCPGRLALRSSLATGHRGGASRPGARGRHLLVDRDLGAGRHVPTLAQFAAYCRYSRE